jgi:hypothetical protein
MTMATVAAGVGIVSGISGLMGGGGSSVGGGGQMFVTPWWSNEVWCKTPPLFLVVACSKQIQGRQWMLLLGK